MPRKRKKYKAAFLDRDGVINKEVDHLRRIKDIRLLPGAAAGMRILRKKGFRIVLVSNQAGVAKGLLSFEMMEEIHNEIRKRLSHYGVVIDDAYYCPHHPKGKVSRYKKECACRKPGTGMIRSAARKWNLDLKKSIMIGDTTRDIMTGKKARLKTILVKTGYGGKDGIYKVRPDMIAKNLYEAALTL